LRQGWPCVQAALDSAQRVDLAAELVDAALLLAQLLRLAF
jgi:hypothetical protein